MLKEFILGNEALDYIASELSKGRGLARALSEIPPQQCSVVAILPDNVAPSALTDFESGDVASGEENERLADLIEGFLKGAAETSVSVFEHTGATKGNPFLRRSDLDVFFVGDDVYLFADATSSRDRILRMVKKAHWYPSIGVLSRLPEQAAGIKNGEERAPELLRQLATGVSDLFVGAYDGESWLMWHRK